MLAEDIITRYLWGEDYAQTLGEDGARKQAKAILAALKEAGIVVKEDDHAAS